jgi:hypothetical protein
MTPLLCKTPSLRLGDGREVDYNYILSQGHPGIVELAGAVLLPGASDEERANIASLPHTAGDDAQDVMLGAYNIAKNLSTFGYPAPYTFTDAPAIVVGSAPSLTKWLPKLRETYGNYLIVASASAVRPLVEAGIIPHIVAPKERTRYPEWCFDICPDTPLYAGLSVVPDLAERFPHRWCVGDASNVPLWAGCDLPIAPGPTSGTHAMSMALLATSGPVCLVGMDNCGGHYSGYQGTENASPETVLCHDGQMRSSKWLYRVARANMQRKHDDRCVQLCKSAAMIEGIPYGWMPRGKSFTMPKPTAIHAEKRDRLRWLLKQLPRDWDEFWGHTQAVSTIAGTQLPGLHTENKILFNALLTPLCIQLSMERRLGMSDANVIQWYREATRNMIEMLSSTIHSMATIGGHYE